MKETVDPSVNAISVLLLMLSSLVVLALCFMRVVEQVIRND
jgi:hypothetical protein